MPPNLQLFAINSFQFNLIGFFVISFVTNTLLIIIIKSGPVHTLQAYLPRTVLLMIPTATVCLISRTAKRPRGGY